MTSTLQLKSPVTEFSSITEFQDYFRSSNKLEVSESLIIHGASILTSPEFDMLTDRTAPTYMRIVQILSQIILPLAKTAKIELTMLRSQYNFSDSFSCEFQGNDLCITSKRPFIVVTKQDQIAAKLSTFFQMMNVSSSTHFECAEDQEFKILDITDNEYGMGLTADTICAIFRARAPKDYTIEFSAGAVKSSYTYNLFTTPAAYQRTLTFLTSGKLRIDRVIA